MDEHAYRIATSLIGTGHEPVLTDETLLSACNGDASLADRVRELLQDISAGQKVAQAAFRDDIATGVRGSSLPRMLGRYQLQNRIGVGGFGQVWKALDPELNRPVAIKIADADRISSPEVFLREARNVANLDHPSIVPVYDFGREGDHCYIVSRLIDGRDLSAVIRENRSSVPAEAAHIIASIADALAAAHAQGLVHRDVKPSNILLDDQGNAFLTDFGIAVGRRDLLSLPRVSSGTLAYMSPEQVRGDNEHLDPRSDIFSLGAVLYELLVGERSFVGDDASQLRNQILESDPWPPQSRNARVPSHLNDICLKALAKSPDDRFRNAEELACALRRCAGAGRLPRPPGMRTTTIGIALIVILLACTWALWPRLLRNRLVRPSLESNSTAAVDHAKGTASSQTSSTSPAAPTKQPDGAKLGQQLRSFAVLEFENHARSVEYRNWGKALRDMLMTDVARAPGVVVVERARLNDVLAEHHLSAAKFIDPSTAVQLGRGVAAHWVLTGALTVDGAEMRIDARAVSVEEGTVAFADSVQGTSSILALERSLVQRITRKLVPFPLS